MTYFADVRVDELFLFGGVWYIKINPMPIAQGAVYNALRYNDDSQGRWFEPDEKVFMR